MDSSLLIWLVPLCPLIGFLINAFLGARLTGSPRPVVETGPVETVRAAPAIDPTDVSGEPEYDMEAASAAHEATQTEADDAASDHGDHAADAAHGGHSADPHLSAGGMRLVGGIATVVIGIAFALALMLFFQVQGAAAPDHRLFSSRWDWMSIPSVGNDSALNVGFGLMVDPLTSLMTLIITGVGFLIHLYSTAYMSHDKGYARYFTYLNLFVFFMLLLVMGANLPVLFVGWEGVGLASYLLIGFWAEKKSATDAGKKAFIVNRIGDCALLIAMFLIFHYFGTLDFYGTNGILTPGGLERANGIGYSGTGVGPELAAVALVPFLMFLGAAGKSAQIPLYVWLPDAMEGPTPVSALIHAATMVTGGVYLLSRTHDLFLLSPGVMTIVAVVGLSTAFLAATIALVQNDIKRVLAYSTVSQLGYMFLACGVGAFGTAMFHVTTHAFFKALLFLGSGSVIHAMSGEQDMRKMGGLKDKIPTTYRTMWIGTLAIAGFPLLAGFWSKDAILLNAFAGPSQGGLGSPILWATGFVVSGLTAFYMVRMMMKTFEGKPRYSSEVAAHIHESPPSMTVPLMVLAALSLLGGFLNADIPGMLHLTPFENFLGTTVDWRPESNLLHVEQSYEYLLLAASAVLAVVVIVMTYNAYRNKPNGELNTEAEKQRNPLWRFLSDKWGIDGLYDSLFVKPGKDLARFLWRVVDLRGVDGAVNGTGRLITGAANGIKGWQSGYVRSYAFSLLIGVVIVVLGCLVGLGMGR